MAAGRILITGATGFCGRALVAHAREAGWATTLAVRRPGFLSAGEANRVVAIDDVGPAADWRDALEGVESVVHLAGLAHDAGRGEAELNRVNRDGTAALAQAAAATPTVTRFVFVSSITVLGEGGAGPVDDRSPCAPATAYARSKHAAEDALRAAFVRSDIDATILRPPLLAGPGVKGNLASLLRVLDTPLPVPLGGIGNRRTLLGVNDLADAIAAVLADPPVAGRCRTYAVGDPAPISTTSLARALRDGLGRPTRLVPAPVALLRGAAAIAGRPGLARRLLEDLVVDGSGFAAAFGWSPRTGTIASLRAAGAAWRESTTARGRPFAGAPA